MERLHALWMLYQVESYARAHGHKAVVDWTMAEIKEHSSHLSVGESTQLPAVGGEEPEE